MFCTTLRRRPSFAPAIPSLQAPNGLALRESKLSTHDIVLSLNPLKDPKTGNMTAIRHYRFLLLSRSSTTNDAKLEDTLKRIHHFASLTGGQDLAIIFLLSPPQATTFISASALTTTTGSNTADSTKGLHAYTLLQATLSTHSEIPYLPILPLSSLQALPDLLRRYTTSIASARPVPPGLPSISTFQLLQLCTAAPGGKMSEQTAFVLSDIFPDFAALATACTAQESSMAGSSSPSWRIAGGNHRGMEHGVSASQIESELGKENEMGSVMDVDAKERADEKLRDLRALVGEQEFRDLVDYWREEWTVD